MVLAFDSLLSSNVFAQCPDSTGPAPNPDSVAWVSGFSTTQTIPGTSCQITIYFCQRFLPDGSEQIYVYEVDPDLSGDCDSITPSQLIRYGQTLVVNDPAVNLGKPCFKGEFILVHTYLPECWNLDHYTPILHVPVYVACIQNNYCRISCKVCVNPGPVVSETDCTGEEYFSAPCGIAPPDGTPWVQSTCYTLGCTAP